MQKKQRIVRILRIIMPIVAVLSAVVFVPWDILPWITPLPDTVQEQVDAATDHGLDGIIVYVDQAGQAPAFYTAGWKDKLTQEPADPQALFKIGSIQKLYVATAVAKLASAGRLSLDDTLAELLPEVAGRIDNAEQITVRMIVQHRSGIPNFTDDPEFDWFTPQTDASKNLELILDKPADFKPDARYSYSNTNYLLLGMILDRVLEYPYEEYIQNEILAPLGLTHTYFSLDQVEYDDVVSGYWYGYDDDLRYLGGSMLASAQDVGVFLRALNDGSLLNDDEQAIYSSIYEYEHTGWVPGYYSIARYYEDMDTVVVQFVNTTGGDTLGLANVTGGKALGISNIIYNRVVRILRKEDVDQ
ncbi:MAG: D-alanyl-D-alanine carboxypeptidase [Chloroflexota bacterium]|nr:D-alanyl-D-alanine carboxypeptidase [Chloroflexota bacterium]